MTFDDFTVVLLMRGDKLSTLSRQERDSLQDIHLAHLAKLHEAGTLLAAGPIMGVDDRDLRGISLLNVDIPTAQDLCEDDPGVKSGLFKNEYFQWLVPGGAMSFQQTFFPSSIADVH